jgi:hypothetical protein
MNNSGDGDESDVKKFCVSPLRICMLVAIFWRRKVMFDRAA